MKSAIGNALRLKNEPVALLFSDEKPEGAVQFEPGKWGCVMFLLAAAAGGRPAVANRQSFGCPGGGLGLGFGNTYLQFPGGLPGFCRFLSTGNGDTEEGRAIGAGMKAGGAREEFVDHFLHGERYKKTPEVVEQFVAALPILDIPSRYVVMKPLSHLAPEETPVSVTFLVDADRLSALVIFANYDRPGLENAAIPYAAACQTVGILSYREAKAENPRALVGMVDISARKYLRAKQGKDKLSFTVPWRRFLEMEANVPGSFLEGETWRPLVAEE